MLRRIGKREQMAKFEKTIAELQTELREQMLALRSSLTSYDSGKKREAKRIAATLYILCHDGKVGRTKSLLGMLDLKRQVKFYSSHVYPDWGPPPPGMEIVGETFYPIPTPLVMLHGTGEYRPAWEAEGPVPKENLPQLSFDAWWEEVIFAKSSNITKTRKKMILHVRDQDGGSHVDDHVDDLSYKILKTVGSEYIKISRTINGVASEPVPVGNIVWPIIRQIGWELDHSLAAHGI